VSGRECPAVSNDHHRDEDWEKAEVWEGAEVAPPLWLASKGSGAKLVGIESGVISGLNLASQIRRLAAAVGDNANDDRYSKYFGW
jgi:hypothetical protein